MSYNPFHRRARGDASSTEFPATVASLPAEMDLLPALSDSRPPVSDSLPSDLGPGAPDLGADSGHDSVPMPVEQRPTIAFVGRYALKGVIGTGGLGQVHEAWDPLLSRPVAVKTLQFDIDPADRESLDELFINEARASAGLSHAHIVTVHDAGRSEHGVYIAMERLQGKDLRQRLGEGWLPTPAQAAQLVRRVADALAYAHARGVVHCDVKPANIFLNKRDKPKVLDFGIARVAHSRVLSKLEGMVAGSPHYLAPEQLNGGTVDARTDIHALGVVFYELLTLRKAFSGDTVEQITTAVLTNHPAPAHELRPGVPRTLAGIAAKAMARDPGDRYSSAAEMSADLRRWIERNAASETPAVVEMPGSASSLPGALPLIPPPHTRPRRTRARKSRPVGAIVAVASLVVGALALLSTLRRPPTPEPLPELAAVPAVAEPAASVALVALPASAAVEVPASAPEAALAAASAAAPDLPVTPPAAPVVVATTPTANPPAPETPVPPVAKAPTAVPAPRAAPAKPKAAVAPVRDTRSIAATATAPAAPPAQGQLQLAISPWGQVEVNGQAMGTTPPLTRLTLAEGSHTITVRNEDFPPYTTTVQVVADKPVTLRHRFGQ